MMQDEIYRDITRSRTLKWARVLRVGAFDDEYLSRPPSYGLLGSHFTQLEIGLSCTFQSEGPIFGNYRPVMTLVIV